MQTMRILLLDTGETIDDDNRTIYTLPAHVKKWPKCAVQCKIVQVYEPSIAFFCCKFHLNVAFDLTFFRRLDQRLTLFCANASKT